MSAGPTQSSSLRSTSVVAAAVPDTSTAITESITKAPIVETTAEPSTSSGPNVGHPQEQMEVEESASPEANVNFPIGPKLWFTYIALCIAMLLHGLDLAIVAVAVPKLTDHFKTINDIGWYSAAYGLVGASFMFFFGKCYTVFNSKHVYLFGLVTFELGSLLCTVAPTSKAFIIGRALAGLGASAFGSGQLKLLKDMFPLSKQAMATGVMGGCQSVGLVAAPIVGGLLIQRFGWRGCFGINLPLGVMCIAFTVWAFDPPNVDLDESLSLMERIKRLDLIGTTLVVPSIACLLLGLQWGGIRYGWSDWRIILLFIVFGVLFAAFVYVQYRQGEKAIIPPRIIKSRNIIGSIWFSACCNGILAMTEYYITIYFQGVRGYSPAKSGLLGVPMLVGLMVASLISATGTTVIGYFYPFLFATTALAPIASGLLTTVDLDNSVVKPAALLGFLGAAIGLGINSPALAIQSTLSSKDVPIGGAIVGFGAGLGSAVWICVSATMFQSRLQHEIKVHSPMTNVTMLEGVGLSGIRMAIGPDRLRDVLSGYNEAVVQTLYMPLALGISTILAVGLIERKNLKKKTE